MSGVQQVVNDFLSIDYSETGLAEPHVVSSLSHGTTGRASGLIDAPGDVWRDVESRIRPCEKP